MEITDVTRPFVDLVQVVCPASPGAKPSFGSGLLVAPGIVLTALHCATVKEQNWRRREDISVHLWRDLYENDISSYQARIIWPPPDLTNPPDLAVLEIGDRNGPQPLLQWAYCKLPSSEFGAEARGFPNVAGGGLLGGRRAERLAGRAILSTASPPTLAFTSTRAAAIAGMPSWAGLSGGPLLSNTAVLGVMREIPAGWDGTRNLDATPLSPLLSPESTDTELRRNLVRALTFTGELGPAPTEPQPQPAWPPAPPDPEFQRLWSYVYTLNRDDEMAEAVQAIGPHVGRRPVELLVSGRPEDLCEEFFRRLWRERLGPRPPNAPPQRYSSTESPDAIAWPRDYPNVDDGASRLAAAALSILGYSQLWGAMPDLLRQKLQAAPQPPWLCLRLPNDPAPLDVAVLGRWRQVWAGLQVADGCPLGYVVLYAGTAPLRSDIILDDTDEAVVAVRGLGQGRVSLRRITIDELRNWEGHLRGLEPPPRPDAAGVPPPLSLIASRVAEKVSQRRLAELRLAAIQRLLRGDADWYSSAA